MKLLARLLTAAFLAAPITSLFAADEKPVAPAAPVAAPAADAAPAAAAATAKADLAQGQAKFMLCVACHGTDGNSTVPVNPKLAQQHPEYLVKQLQEFKNGKRPSPIMQGFASMLSDGDMKNIAYWVGSQKAKPGAAKDKELVTMGERIYRGGIAERQVAACAGCHSPNGAGIPAQFPRLSGQHADYTTAQLLAFRDGARKNSIQMTQVANKLNDREIKAIADYISGLR